MRRLSIEGLLRRTIKAGLLALLLISLSLAIPFLVITNEVMPALKQIARRQMVLIPQRPERSCCRANA